MMSHHQSSLRSWLVYPNAITKRLEQRAGQAILQVLSQDFIETSCSSSQLSRIWSREIIISAYDEICWFARTIVPEHTYQMCQDFFSQLKKGTTAWFYGYC